MVFKELAHTPVYHQVAERLRDAILKGELPPGSQLPTERELGDAFGVSRTSIREAIRALETQGLIASSGRTTARWVAVPTPDGPLRTALAHLLTLGEISLNDLVEVRCALEGEAVALAASRFHDASMKIAEAALEAMMELGEGGLQQFDSADVTFHLALVEASGNRALNVMMLAIRNEVGRQLRQRLRSLENAPESIAKLTAEHRAIYNAVRRGDGLTASALVRSHITDFYRQAEIDSGEPN